MRPRLFTPEEANALLPRLSTLLLEMQEIQDRYDRLQEKAAEYALRMASNGNVVEKELNEVRQESAKAAAQLNTMIDNAQETGCEIKDVSQGLVDFRSEREGREVYLCWKLGEPDVRWWHELETGFAGRQPLE